MTARREILQGYFMVGRGRAACGRPKKFLGSPRKIQKSLYVFLYFPKSLNTFQKFPKSVYEKYKIHSLYFPRNPQKNFFRRPAAGDLGKPGRNTL